jgi:hypothetical protein
MKRYQNPDGTFKGGFDGCVNAFTNCATVLTDASGLCAHIGMATGKSKSSSTEASLQFLIKEARNQPQLRGHLLPIIRKCAATRKEAQKRDVPKEVQQLAAEIRKNQPEYDPAKAYATAWSIYCKYLKPDSHHCKKPREDYFPGS